MPTYDYECRVCGYELEAFHSMSAPPLKDCPECGRPELKKRIGAGAGLIFKGSGFYSTDYRSDSYKKGAKDAASKSEGSSSGSSDTKSSKPAAGDGAKATSG